MLFRAKSKSPGRLRCPPPSSKGVGSPDEFCFHLPSISHSAVERRLTRFAFTSPSLKGGSRGICSPREKQIPRSPPAPTPFFEGGWITRRICFHLPSISHFAVEKHLRRFAFTSPFVKGGLRGICSSARKADPLRLRRPSFFEGASHPSQPPPPAPHPPGEDS